MRRLAPAIWLLLGTTALAARDPALECATQKLAVVGRDARCRLAAHAKALRKGWSAPVTKPCDATLAVKYRRIELKFGGACDRNDAWTVRAATQRYADGVLETAQGRLHCSEDPSRLAVPPEPPSRPVPTEATNAGPGVLKVADGIYMAPGFGNTFLVTTPEGNVVIDTSLTLFSKGHHDALKAIDAGPVRYIILTHGHSDHTAASGSGRRRARRSSRNPRRRSSSTTTLGLSGVVLHRAFEQFSELLRLPPRPFLPPRRAGRGLRRHALRDDDVRTRSASSASAASRSSSSTRRARPTITCPSGSPRSASHSPATTSTARSRTSTRSAGRSRALRSITSSRSTAWLRGSRRFWRRATRAPRTASTRTASGCSATATRSSTSTTRTVQGMNAGIDVYTLMQTITLPPELDVGEGYGAVAWSVRGIYEGYLGWFDENPATMYSVAPADTYRELLTSTAIRHRSSRVRPSSSRPDAHPEAIRLTDVVSPAIRAIRRRWRRGSRPSTRSLAASHNINERGWLNAAKSDAPRAARTLTRRRLEPSRAAPSPPPTRRTRRTSMRPCRPRAGRPAEERVGATRPGDRGRVRSRRRSRPFLPPVAIVSARTPAVPLKRRPLVARRLPAPGAPAHVGSSARKSRAPVPSATQSA
jgi:hypothetical protein